MTALGERIAIVGIAGSGKSTLARELGRRLRLPVIHLDRVYWRPGWQPRPDDEFAAIQRELVASERWVIDGNYSGTLPLRLARATAVIYLDLPRRVVLPRVALRTLRERGRVRADSGDGCPEKLDLQFIRWIWETPRRSRPKVLALLDDARARGVRVEHLRSQREVDALLAALPTCAGEGLRR